MTNNDSNNQGTPIIFDGWRSITISLFMALVGYSVMVTVPVLSTALVTKAGFGEGDVGKVWGNDLLGFAIGSIIVAFLVAKVNRRYLVVAGIVLTAGGNALCMAFDSYTAMLMLRVVAGIGSGIFTGVAIATLGGATNTVRAFNLLLFAFAFTTAFELWLFPKLSMNGIYLFLIGTTAVCGLLLHWVPRRPLNAEELGQQEAGEDHTDDWRVPKFIPIICLTALTFCYINIGGYYTYIELAALKDNITDDMFETSEDAVDITLDKVQITLEKVAITQDEVHITEDMVDIVKDNVHITVAQVGTTENKVPITEDMVEIAEDKISITVDRARVTLEKVESTEENVELVELTEGKLHFAVPTTHVTVTKFNITQDWTGLVLEVTGFLGVLGCGIAFLCTRFGLFRPLFAGLIFMSISVIMLSRGITNTNLAVSLFGFMTFWTFVDVFQSAMISNMDRSGAMIALMPAVEGFGQFLGPHMGAFILDHKMGYNVLFMASGSMTMIAMFLYFGVFLYMRRKKTASPEATT